jgi:predicted acyl esterase
VKPNEDHPDGFAMNLTDGILRVRYRRSWERPELLRAGEIAAVKVEAFPTSNLFQRGYKIRIDVSSSNFPHFDVNPNSGAGGHRAHAQHRPQHPVPRQASRLARDLADRARARVSLPRL